MLHGVGSRPRGSSPPSSNLRNVLSPLFFFHLLLTVVAGLTRVHNIIAVHVPHTRRDSV
jgi:hypothetical protein